MSMCDKAIYSAADHEDEDEDGVIAVWLCMTSVGTCQDSLGLIYYSVCVSLSIYTLSCLLSIHKRMDISSLYIF